MWTAFLPGSMYKLLRISNMYWRSTWSCSNISQSPAFVCHYLLNYINSLTGNRCTFLSDTLDQDQDTKNSLCLLFYCHQFMKILPKGWENQKFSHVFTTQLPGPNFVLNNFQKGLCPVALHQCLDCLQVSCSLMLALC